jgi:ParB family chromosome partitioning protein
VRQTEQLVRAALKAPSGARRPRGDRDLEALENDLSDRLGTRVDIRPGRKGAGQLILRYASLDHLDALLHKLRA